MWGPGEITQSIKCSLHRLEQLASDLSVRVKTGLGARSPCSALGSGDTQILGVCWLTCLDKLFSPRFRKDTTSNRLTRRK